MPSFHVVAFAFDDDGLGMMKDAIQDGDGEGAVVVEGKRPPLDELDGAQDDGVGFGNVG